MKPLFSSLSLVALLVFSTAPTLLRAQDDDDQGVSYQTFYDQLGNEGTWIQTDDYGYVFQPNEPDPDWAPYTDGHWVYTEDGWTWVSNDPWGWATDHYGRWAYIDGTGWIWVPGDQWAPAWVSWRYGDGYAGWAPLPPGTLYGYGGGAVGFHFGGDVDSHYHIGAGHYNFVRTNQLGAPNMRTAIVNRSNNSSFFSRTKNITDINVNRNGGAGFGGVAAGGPPIAQVNAHSAHRVPTMKLAAGTGPGRSSVHGNSLSVYAPRVNAATAHQAKPASVGRTLAHPAFDTGRSTHATTPATVRGNPAVNRTSPAETGRTFRPENQSQTAPREPTETRAPSVRSESRPEAPPREPTETRAPAFHPENRPAPAPQNQPHPQAPRPQARPAPAPHPAPGGKPAPNDNQRQP